VSAFTYSGSRGKARQNNPAGPIAGARGPDGAADWRNGHVAAGRAAC